MSPTAEIRAWLSEYAAHLLRGVGKLDAGEPLTQDFDERCQELDDQIRSLGGDALRAAAETEDFNALWDGVRKASEAFGFALAARMTEVAGERSGASRARVGLQGYAAIGLSLKNQEGRYIERTG